MENGARGKFFWRTATPPTMLVRGAGGWFATSRPQNEQQFIPVVHHCENEERPSLTAEPKRMALVRAGASRPYLLRKRTVGDLPLPSCADDNSLCAWVAIAGCSGRSHDVQGAYPVDAVSAEQYLRGLAHRSASLDADPQIQRGRPSWSSRSLQARRPRNARIALGALRSSRSRPTPQSLRPGWSSSA